MPLFPLRMNDVFAILLLLGLLVGALALAAHLCLLPRWISCAKDIHAEPADEI